ncbi:MAG: hypothetical protein V3R87_10300 [Dehalococcoidia bacterium]
MVCPKCGAEKTGDGETCASCGVILVPEDARSTATSVGLRPNVAALLCYLLGWITGLIFIKLEKENDFVRFHAMQSIVIFGGLMWGIAVAFSVSLLLLEIPNVGVIVWLFWVFGWAWVFLIGILWVFLMVKAYRGRRYKVRWAGSLAEKYL